jgi:UTP--glucose-1-phosphate uridylyltransferase
MGAAIESFSGAGAVCVPRSRFAPVKKCSDLLLLRSDAYEVDAQSVLVLSPVCKGVAPIVDLDDKKYKLVQHLDAATMSGYPSLKDCKKITIKGEFSLHHITPYHITSCHTVSCDIISCHTTFNTPYHIISHHIAFNHMGHHTMSHLITSQTPHQIALHHILPP